MLSPEPILGGAGDRSTLPVVIASGASDGVPSDTTEDDWSRGSGEDPDMEIDRDSPNGRGGGDSLTELDRRVSCTIFSN